MKIDWSYAPAGYNYYIVDTDTNAGDFYRVGDGNDRFVDEDGHFWLFSDGDEYEVYVNPAVNALNKPLISLLNDLSEFIKRESFANTYPDKAVYYRMLLEKVWNGE